MSPSSRWGTDLVGLTSIAAALVQQLQISNDLPHRAILLIIRSDELLGPQDAKDRVIFARRQGFECLGELFLLRLRQFLPGYEHPIDKGFTGMEDSDFAAIKLALIDHGFVDAFVE